MPYSVEVIADSVPAGKLFQSTPRLTTLAITLPRIVLAELNTHRMFSRNSASSRAIPIQRMIDKVVQDPFIPFYWGANQKGMQAHVEIDAASQQQAERQWLLARDAAVEQALKLSSLGVHKQLANRLLEPWLYTTVLVTATDWENSFTLRCHPDAQPELRKAAEMMRDAMAASVPRPLGFCEWHKPYAQPDDADGWEATVMTDVVTDAVEWQQLPTQPSDYAQLLLCVARCARVSYGTSTSLRDRADNVALAKRLAVSGHWSPFEHVATPMVRPEYSANFFGWVQLRRYFKGESGQAVTQ